MSMHPEPNREVVVGKPNNGTEDESPISRVLRKVSVEPLAMFSLFSQGVLFSSLDSLLLEKSCMADMGFASEHCNQIRHNATLIDYRTALKLDTVELRLILLATSVLPAILYQLFAGDWSDNNGRKPIFLIAIFANIARVIIFLLTVYQRRGRVFWVLFADLVFQAFGGGFLQTLCFAYVSDVSKVKSRTIRFAFLAVCSKVGFFGGILSGTYIMLFYSYYAVAIFAFCFSLVSLSFKFLVVSETKKRGTKKKCCQKFIDFFSPSRIIKTATTPFRKRTESGRLRINLLLTSYFFVRFLANCHWVLEEMYTTAVYNWTVADATNAVLIISSTQLLVLVVVSMFVFVFFKLDDVKILIIGMTSSIMSCIIVGSSSWSIMYYTGSICGSFSIFTNVIILSWLTQIVNDDEYGKMMAWICVIEILGGYEASSAFVYLFEVTLSVLPGTVFLLSALLHIIPLVCLYTVYRLMDNIPEELPTTTDQPQR